VITKRKLLTLRKDTRLRKIQRVLQEIQEDPGEAPLREIQEVLSCLEDYSLWKEAQALVNSLEKGKSPSLQRTLHRIRSLILQELGQSQEDWDLHLSPLDPQKKSVLPIDLYLEDIRSPFNLGSMFRSAEALGVRHIYLSPFGVDPLHPRAIRSSMGLTQRMPWSRISLEEIPPELPLIALELGGTSIQEFTFPPEGILALGSEELGLSKEALSRAQRLGSRVSIPLRGGKSSLNVGVALGIGLCEWTCQITL